MPDLRYPIGDFKTPKTVTDDQRREMIRQIAETPANLKKAVAGLSEKQLDTPYREGGWTVRQVVHHLPDSHMNAYVRFKLACTEDEPNVKTYEEKLWAETTDARTAPIDPSLRLLEGLHERWVLFLNSLSPSVFSRKYNHPEHGHMDLNYLTALYAWHGPHHIAQITALRKRMGWA